MQAHPTAAPDEENGSGGQSSGSSGGNPGSGGRDSSSGGDNGSGGSTSSSSGGGGGSGGSPGSGGRSSSGGSQGSGSGGSSSTGGSQGSGGNSSTGGSQGSGGSSASGPGVVIDGNFVPKDKAVVFIHFGHSNMRGQATKPSSLRSYFYDTQPGLWSYKGSFMPSKEPTAPEGTMTFAGPGMAILHSAQMALSSGSDVQFISIGYGIGSKTSVDFQKGGVYYPIFMNWAKELKGNVTFGGIVIMLGVTDGEHLPSSMVPGFPMRIAQIISDMRSDLGEPNLPVLFCDYEQMATGTLAPTGSVGSVMQPLVRMLPGMVSKLVLVPTDGLEMQDDHHFDMQGHKDWADRLVMLMKSNGWFPWK